MFDNIEFVLLIVAAIVGAVVFVNYQKKSGLQELKTWALKNGYELIDYEFRWANMGPYFNHISTKHQRSFFVTLKTKDGEVRKAYVRIGGFFHARFSDEVDVKWKD